MPAILDDDAWASWLGEDGVTRAAEAEALLEEDHGRRELASGRRSRRIRGRANAALELHEISVRISRSMGCRRLRQLLVRWKRASDVIERRLALDLKESDLLAAARPAFKGAGVDRRPVFSEVFSKRKGTVRRWPFGQIARRGSPPRPQAAEPGASMGSWRMVAR